MRLRNEREGLPGRDPRPHQTGPADAEEIGGGENSKRTGVGSSDVRLLALAHKWELMVRQGETDYVELARRHGLSSARVSQICRLTLLAPEIQESLVRSSSLSQRCLPAMAAHPIWREQRHL